MPAYNYKALDATGKAVSGVIDADTARDARQKLRAQQIFATDITEGRKGFSLTSEVNLKTLFKRVGARDISVMTRQLATLVRAGLPLVRALQAIEDQLGESPLRSHIIEVREEVNRGVSLADALEKHPRIFSPLYVSMVRAGESAGALDNILDRLATFSEKTVALRSKVQSAMVYPIFMAVVGVIAVAALLTFVVPTITKIFVETKQQLPALTVALLSVSNFMKGYWWALLAGIIAAVVLVKRLGKRKGAKIVMDRMKLRLPVIGTIIRKMAVSRFARTLSILTASGVPILKAMNIVRGIVNNEVLARAIEKASSAVGEGHSIAEPLGESGVFPPIVSHMISVGEASGKLEEMLENVADAYDTEVENSVAALISLLEPAMIIVMGLVVGFIVIAILMPIFEMNQLVG